MDWIFGLALGGVCAALDAWLMRRIVRRTAACGDAKAASGAVLRGLLLRYALTLAAIAAALFLPGINAIGVILALLAEKALLVICAACGRTD